MRSSVTAVKYAVLVSLVATGLVMLGGTMNTVQATDSTIDVRVCGVESTATISITAPDSDSNHDQQPIIVSGQVDDVSQVTVMVDGVYSHSLAIARDQTDYQTPVTMSAGTHTIEIIGTDICSRADPTASVVVTYTPATPPSTGEDTPTDVSPDPGGPQRSGVVVGDESTVFPGSNIDSPQPVQPDWLSTLPAPIRETVRATDLHTVAQDGAVIGAIRVLAILTGVAFIGGASILAGWFKPKNRLVHTSYRTLFIWQLAGVGLIVLTLLL